MSDEKDSQQEPTHASALQTPQPDQKHPPVSSRYADGPEDPQSVNTETEDESN
jgi:hypothetical protein